MAQTNVGEPFDGFRGYALGGEKRRFCTLYGMGKTAVFSTALYNEDGAHALALVWCDRVQYLYNMWRHGGMTEHFRLGAQATNDGCRDCASGAALANTGTLVQRNRLHVVKQIWPNM